MNNIIETALSAEKETTTIDFKSNFDVDSAQEWCEIIKDIVAIANSGGGVIIFGLNDDGSLSDVDVTPILELDPADVTNRVYKYINHQFSDFTIQKCEKAGQIVAALIVQASTTPLIFEKPGTYDIGGGKQKTAFSMGTVYFRHGAKSEPGNTDDLRKSFERLLGIVRESWLKNVRQVVEAPLGSTVVTISPTTDPNALPVRITDDPNAPIIGGISPDRTHPYRQKELVELVNQKLATDKRINQYDIQCLKKMFDIENNVSFHYHPKFGGHQYSPSFAEWIISKYQEDEFFFDKVREEIRNQKRGNTT